MPRPPHLDRAVARLDEGSRRRGQQDSARPGHSPMSPGVAADKIVDRPSRRAHHAIHRRRTVAGGVIFAINVDLALPPPVRNAGPRVWRVTVGADPLIILVVSAGADPVRVSGVDTDLTSPTVGGGR